MIRLFIKIFLRNFLKNKAFTFLGVLGLVIGLSSSYMLFLWIKHEISFDRFHDNSENIYRIVKMERVSGETRRNIYSPPPLSSRLSDEYPQIAAAASIYFSNLEISYEYDNNFFKLNICHTSEDFFDVFSFPVKQKADTVFFPTPTSVVISKQTAKRLFGTVNCLGYEIVEHFYLQRRYQVSAVIDIPDNSHMHFDMFISFDSHPMLRILMNDWGIRNTVNYIRVEQDRGFTDEQLTELRHYMRSRKIDDALLGFQPLHDIYLFTDFNDDLSAKSGNNSTVQLLSLVAFLVIILAALNYIMLITSRSETRSKEMALKKLYGEKRVVLIMQYAAEIVLVTLFAFLISLLVVYYVLPLFNSLTGNDLVIFPGLTAVFYIFIVLILVSLLAAGYISLYLSKFSALNLLRGRANLSPRFRINSLVTGLQLTFSIGFILFTLSLYAQVSYMLEKDKGLETDNIVSMSLIGFPYKYESIKSKLLQNPGIIGASASGRPPVDYQFDRHQNVSWEGMEEKSDIAITMMFVDPDYAQTFGLELIEGDFLPDEMSVERHFSGTYRDRTPIIINETLKRLLGFSDPIGKKLNLGYTQHNGYVSGVVKDFHFRPLNHSIAPLAMLYDPESFAELYVKVNPANTQDALNYMSEVALLYGEGNYPFDYYFLEDKIRMQYKGYSILATFLIIASLISVCLALLGMLGMSAYKLLRSRKNISLRKIFGADSNQLIGLFVKEMLIINLASYGIAVLFGWFFVDRLMAEFAYRHNMFWWIAIIVLFFSVLLTAVFTTFIVYKNCNENPVNVVKYE